MKVLVTGGTRGIGKAIATRFAKDGASVAIVGTRRETAEQAAREIAEASSAQVLGYGCDVSDTEACASLVAQVLEAFGQIDVLVNNAGITRDNLLMRMQEEDWDRVLAVNLKSAYNMSKAVLRPMMKAHYGRIISTSSVVGIFGNSGQVNYAAAKAGLIGFTKSLAKEVASRNITVNAVAPGLIDTDMSAALPQAAKDAMTSAIPLGRAGKPEDIAGAVAFLASEDANYITGHVICVDGGLCM